VGAKIKPFLSQRCVPLIAAVPFTFLSHFSNLPDGKGFSLKYSRHFHFGLIMLLNVLDQQRIQFFFTYTKDILPGVKALILVRIAESF